MFKLDLEKVEEPDIKLPTSTGSSTKQEHSRKISTLLYWLLQSLWLCGSQQTMENSSRYRNTRPPEKSVCRSGSNSWTVHGTTDWFQIREEIHQGCILSPTFLTYMQSTSWEILSWMKHKLESRLHGEISVTLDIQMTPPLWQKANKN